jgi:hypothetical protein
MWYKPGVSILLSKSCLSFLRLVVRGAPTHSYPICAVPPVILNNCRKTSYISTAVLNVGYAYPLGVRRESSKVARSSNKVAKLADYPVKCL